MAEIDYGTGTADVDTDALERRLREAAQQKGVAYDRSDLDGILRNVSYDRTGQSLDSATSAALRRYDERAAPAGGSESAPATPTAAWSQASSSSMPGWSQGMAEKQAGQAEADRATAQARSTALFEQLQQRATQGLDVSASDPVIRGQVDAFRSESERSLRNSLSDAAERQGPYANLSVERRMGTERLGQGVAGFQAQLMGRELQNRRDEIAQALSQQGAMLSGDQQRALQAQLASLDQAIKEGNLTLGQRGLDVQERLGMADLGYKDRALSQSGDQFLRELALREWMAGNEDFYTRSGLR